MLLPCRARAFTLFPVFPWRVTYNKNVVGEEKVTGLGTRFSFFIDGKLRHNTDRFGV